MSKTSEMTIRHVIENLNLPQESYSPWSSCIINYGLKSRNKMRDHSIYILYSLSSKDLQRTWRKWSVGRVVSLLALIRLNSISPAKIARKCLGIRNDSHKFLEFREQKVSPKSSRDFRETGRSIEKAQVNRVTWEILIHPVHILKYFNSPILPMYFYSFDYECG